MTGKLAGKVALITGASAGIGWASALALAQEGASLVLTARRQERLEELKQAVEKAGGKAVFIVGDAAQEEIAKRCVSAAVETFGALDILVNNVGVGNYKNIVDTSADEYDEMMDTNVRSTFLFTRHAVPVMLKQGSGTILMISSMAGLYGFAGEAVYCATKFAQVGFAQALDKELRPHGIKVGRHLPRRGQDGIRPRKRPYRAKRRRARGMLEPEDVAGAVLLACTQSSNRAHHRSSDAHDERILNLRVITQL